MNRSQIVDHYIQKSRKTGFEIDQIRRELTAAGVPEEEIRIIVRLVDSELQRHLQVRSTASKKNELTIAGALLTMMGAGLTVATFTGIIDMNDSFLIVYGPFFGGLGLMAGGEIRRGRFRRR